MSVDPTRLFGPSTTVAGVRRSGTSFLGFVGNLFKFTLLVVSVRALDGVLR